MKKLFALIMVIGLFTLASCGGGAKKEGEGTEAQGTEQMAPEAAPEAAPAPMDSTATPPPPAEGGGGGH